MQKIDHTLFIHTLKAHGITQKAFAEYAKIPYDTVTGWKKKGKVPAYAMVIAKDMAYRMRLDEQTRKTLQRRHKRSNLEVIGLDKTEQKRIEAAFWGTNYTAGEIIENAKKGDKRFMQRLKENLPETLQRKALSAQVKHC
ncbi:hypothetical protein [Hydrogenimonas sp. SS33]|uniref:hypothetical protein n=1 Tax=Hydrogenimonas leucolamina TaxID=2954236 RepID=UPI00336C0B0A